MRYCLLLVCLTATGCGPWAGYKPGPGDNGYGGPTSPSSTPSRSVTAADHDFCLSETNRYRALAGVPPVGTASSTLQAFADAGATADNLSHLPNDHYLTAGGALKGYGEIELTAWSAAQAAGSVHDIIASGLAGAWAEGTYGGLYITLTNVAYGQMGCGIAIGTNSITITQDFF